MKKTLAWLEEYNRTVGASRAAAVLGLDRFHDRADIYDRMAGRIPLRLEEPSPDQERGEWNEPKALEKLAKALDAEVVPHDQEHFLYHPDYPHAHALPDGWVACKACGGAGRLRGTGSEHAPDCRGECRNCPVPVEVEEQCSACGGAGRWPAELKVPRPRGFAHNRDHGLLQGWHCQAQHTLGITSAAQIDVGILNPVTLELLHFRVERDDDEIAIIMASELEFFLYVCRREFPMPAPAAEKLPKSKKGGLVTIVDGDGARAAAQGFWPIYEARRAAEAFLEECKEMEAGARAHVLAAAPPGCEKFEVPGLGRFHHGLSPGRRHVDPDALLAWYEHAKQALPDLDQRVPSVTTLIKTGDPYRSFRGYPPKGDSP